MSQGAPGVRRTCGGLAIEPHIGSFLLRPADVHVLECLELGLRGSAKVKVTLGSIACLSLGRPGTSVSVVFQLSLLRSMSMIWLGLGID